MPYNRMKGLGFKDRNYALKNDVDPDQRWSGQDFERRHSDAKHGRHEMSSDPNEDSRYRGGEGGGDWSHDLLSEDQARFVSDFDRDMSLTHRSGRTPHEQYTGINRQILEKKWNEWKRRGREYGLSDKEAENALSHWLSLND